MNIIDYYANGERVNQVHNQRFLPRIGELVQIDDEVFKVVSVMHNTSKSTARSIQNVRIIVKKIGNFGPYDKLTEKIDEVGPKGV